MIVAGLMFATMGVFVKLGAEHFDAAELAFYRNFVSLIFVGALVAVRGGSLKTTHGTAHFVRGLTGSISLIGYFYAMTQLPLATAQTLNYTSPLFLAITTVVVLARFWAGSSPPLHWVSSAWRSSCSPRSMAARKRWR
jgi:drug/metabolite transporter (DMT)-like permease